MEGFKPLSPEESALLRQRVLEDKFGRGERDPLAANLASTLRAYATYEEALEDGTVTEVAAADYFRVAEEDRLTRFTPEAALLSGRFAPKAVLKHMGITREKLADFLRDAAK